MEHLGLVPDRHGRGIVYHDYLDDDSDNDNVPDILKDMIMNHDGNTGCCLLLRQDKG